MEVPAREYVPLPPEAVAPVQLEPYPAEITNRALERRVRILTAALSLANLKLGVIACLDGLEPNSAPARACLAALEAAP